MSLSTCKHIDIVKTCREHGKEGLSKQGSAQDYWHANQVCTFVKASRQTHGATFCCSVSALRLRNSCLLVPKRAPEGRITAHLERDNHAVLSSSSLFGEPIVCAPSPSCFLLIAAAFFTPSISISPCHTLHQPNLPPAFLPLLCEADKVCWRCYWRCCLQPALSPPQREAQNLNGLHSQGCCCASVHSRMSVSHFLRAHFQTLGIKIQRTS